MPPESDPIADWILNFSNVVPAAKLELENIHQGIITPHEIEFALDDVLGLEEHNDLMKEQFDKERIVGLLRSYDFTRLRPELLEEVSFPDSILSASIPTSLREEVIKYGGQIWKIYKNDADPFPSNPHAHNAETGYKLDLSNGKLYSRRKIIGHIPYGKLLQVRQRVKHNHLPLLATGSGN